MRLEVVARTLANNTVVSRLWVAAIVPAGVAMTSDQIYAIWRAHARSSLGAASDCARVIGYAKNRGDKPSAFKLLEDDPRSNMWMEYIEHPDKSPIELPAAPALPAAGAAPDPLWGPAGAQLYSNSAIASMPTFTIPTPF
jgi:hypothetical protein